MKSIIDAYPANARNTALKLRDCIFSVADERRVGLLTETLKWGEPSYLTEQTKAGSTVRLGWSAKRPDVVGLFFNCNTNLVDRFRQLFPTSFEYIGNREIRIPIGTINDIESLEVCIGMALTYHRDKSKKVGR
ncbi:MAG: DUF1801 domain-containing protein [Alphaproteobacteria bacterium]